MSFSDADLRDQARIAALPRSVGHSGHGQQQCDRNSNAKENAWQNSWLFSLLRLFFFDTGRGYIVGGQAGPHAVSV